MKENIRKLQDILYFQQSGEIKEGNYGNRHVKHLRICLSFKKVIGVGPGGYYSASQKYLSAETLDAIRRSTKNIDPHNTFLQSLINFGVVGTVCYLGIFGYAVRQFIAAAKKDRTKLAFIMLIVAYFLRNHWLLVFIHI